MTGRAGEYASGKIDDYVSLGGIMRARYRVYQSPDGPDFDNPWVDMPEAEPRTRAKLKEDVESSESFVVVNDAGGVDYDEANVEIDTSNYYE